MEKESDLLKREMDENNFNDADVYEREAREEKMNNNELKNSEDGFLMGYEEAEPDIEAQEPEIDAEEN